MTDPYGRYPKTGPVCVECQQIVRAVNTKGLCRDCQPKKPKKGKRGSRAATRMACLMHRKAHQGKDNLF